MYVSSAYPPHYTGIGAYTYNMARAFSALGHQVFVATSRVEGCPETEESEAGTIFRCYSEMELRSEGLARRLMRLARENRVDLIECADFLGEGGPLLRLPRDIPVCIKAHNSGPVRVGREAEVLYSWQRWMQWAAILRNWQQFKEEKYSIEHGEFLITPSARLMRELEGQGFRLPKKRFVQPNPIVLAPAAPDVQESAAPTVLFVGRLAIGKGIALLPGLLRELVDRFPDIRLVVAGGDSYARGIGSLRRWLGKRFGQLVDHIEFTGQLGRDELKIRFESAWLLIAPSLWDTFPTVVLEAMSHAKPVVGSIHGGMPEMLEGTLCHAVDPGSAAFLQETVRLLEDRRLRQAAGHSMFLKARTNYAPEVVAGQYIERLTELMR